ncbi:MAG: DUF4293 domain-containing protein [Cyclobacteriaceae bacterium]|jgi:hypothetical protein
MWQRVQTVFLVLCVACLVASFMLPIWTSQEPDGTERQLYALHYSVIQNGERTTTYFPYALTAMLMAAAATVAVIEIRRFDNRMTQIKLGTLNSLLLAGIMICMVVFFNQMVNQFGGKNGISLWVVFGAVACNWLAIRFIRRDERLVRDSDRIR